MNKKLIVGAIAAVSCFAALTPVAQADPPGSGWDKNPDVVLGGGSDTTYLVSQRLEVLYNGAPGCAITTGTASTNKGRCSDTGAALTGPANGNYDHDVLASAAATGSSAGVNALLTPTALGGTGVQYNPPIDYARSSRPISSGEAEVTTAWGYARDGIAVLSFGTRTTVGLSRQDLIDIYLCNKTNWSEFGQPARTIVPWDMNASSGTSATFRSYLGLTAFGPCVRKLASGVAPFENDVKPLLADAGPDGVFGPNPGTGINDDDENNYLWWMSFGNWTKYPFTKNGRADGSPTGTVINSSLVTVEGTLPSGGTIFGSTYAIMRTLYHVTRNTEADCRVTAGSAGACDNAANTVYGTTTGKGGAVREFTQWLCRSTAATQTINPVTGQNYRNAIVDAVNAEGFQVLSTTVANLRTPGYSCSVTTS